MQEVCEPVTALGWGQISIRKHHGRVFAGSSKCRGGTRVGADLHVKSCRPSQTQKCVLCGISRAKWPFFEKTKRHTSSSSYTPPLEQKLKLLAGLEQIGGEIGRLRICRKFVSRCLASRPPDLVKSAGRHFRAKNGRGLNPGATCWKFLAVEMSIFDGREEGGPRNRSNSRICL